MYVIAQWHGVESHLHANDTQSYYSFDLNSHVDYAKAVKKVANCIMMLMTKTHLNDMMAKLNLMALPHPDSSIRETDRTLPLMILKLCQIKQPKNIVIIFEVNLTMDPYTKYVCKNALSHVRNIANIRHHLTSYF